MIYSIFYLQRRIDNPGYPLIMLFSIFLGVTFAQLGSFSEVGDWNLFSAIISFQGIELFKIEFQGIYESNNHLFHSRAYWFLKIWLSTPEIVWIKM